MIREQQQQQQQNNSDCIVGSPTARSALVVHCTVAETLLCYQIRVTRVVSTSDAPSC